MFNVSRWHNLNVCLHVLSERQTPSAIMKLDLDVIFHSENLCMGYFIWASQQLYYLKLKEKQFWTIKISGVCINNNKNQHSQVYTCQMLLSIASFWQRRPRWSFWQRRWLTHDHRISLGRHRTRSQRLLFVCLFVVFSEFFRLNQDILLTTDAPLLLDQRQLRKWPLRRLGCFCIVTKQACRHPGQCTSGARRNRHEVFAGENRTVEGTEQKNYPISSIRCAPGSRVFKMEHLHVGELWHVGRFLLVLLLHRDNFHFLCTPVRGGKCHVHVAFSLWIIK